MKNCYFLIIVALFLFSGCRKEDQRPENKLLGTWQKVKLESKTNTTDWKVLSQPCQLDDLEEYRPSGDWTLFSGAAQCSPGNGVLRGTWKQAADGSKLIYTYEGAGGEYESTLAELTDDQMVLVQSTGQTNGQQIRFTYERR